MWGWLVGLAQQDSERGFRADSVGPECERFHRTLGVDAGKGHSPSRGLKTAPEALGMHPQAMVGRERVGHCAVPQ